MTFFIYSLIQRYISAIANLNPQLEKRQLGSSGRNAALLVIFVLLYMSCTPSSNSIDKPNIILIYADDLGKGLLSHEGQQIITTPNIDKLAQEGIRFQNAYSCMLCAPARASLISGMHDCHEEKFEITNAGIYKKISTNVYTKDQIESLINNKLTPVAEDVVYLGQIAKASGYVTAQIGKLDWGFATTHQQMKRHGWDYYFGYLDHVRAHGFYPPFLFHNGNQVNIPGNLLPNCGKSGEPETPQTFDERWDMTGKKVYTPHIFLDSAISFINNNKHRPFFLYFPTQLPHGPVSIPKVHPDYISNENLTQIEKEYASMVKLLDDDVGRLMTLLKNLEIDNKTIVILSSDNGHEIYYAQQGRIHKPYTNINTGERFDNLHQKYYSEVAGDVFNGNGGRAGLKRSNLQGGIEVPLIIRWPEKIRPGRTSNHLVANYDLLATIAEITGFNDPVNTDGISFFPELNESANPPEHEYVLYSSFLGPTLITNDGWKIRSHLASGEFELFYLPDDYKEANDLSQEHPEKFDALKNELVVACSGDLENGHYLPRKNQMRIE